MTKHRSAVLFVLMLAFWAAPAAAQRASTTGTPTRTIVTVLPKKKDAKLPNLYKEDVFVYEGGARDGVLDWMPLQGNNAALEFFIVIDDGLNGWFAHQVEDLRNFVNALPASTAVGVGYMRNGTVTIAQDMTTDHAKMAKALRLPAGVHGNLASPYLVLADLISRWPNDPVRREILLVSDGIDALFRGGSNQNPYVDQAVKAAQQGNVIVHCMFARGSGAYGMSQGLMMAGQNFESQLTHATGGQFYFMDFGSGPSIEPYLKDLAYRFDHQFLLTFLAQPEGKAGFRPIKVKTEVPNVELIAPERVYVPATKK